MIAVCNRPSLPSLAGLLAGILISHCALADGPMSQPDVPPPDASAAMVADGFEVEVFLKDLTYPTSAEFDDAGNLYIAESGYSYGDPAAPPRILRVSPEGELQRVAERGLMGPVNDLLWHQGRMYVAHRGIISLLDGDELFHIVQDLPSKGDHHTNQMTAGPDGKIYFGQGTATNSGVVGMDNYKMGWLKKHAEFHDVPARDLVLADQPFESPNPFTKDENDKVNTYAFHPFAEPINDKLKVEGMTKANGAILCVNPDGSDLKAYAWGLRNPFGVQWSPQGMLFATENGMDARGSRPIANDWEDLYMIEENGWYGWPDYCSGMPITDERFQPEDKSTPTFLMKDHPPVKQPYMKFPKHSAITKIGFSQGGPFGSSGTMYVAFFGHMAPMTGKVQEHAGHQVLKIDLEQKKSEPFFGKKEHGGEHEGHKEQAAGGKQKQQGGHGHSEASPGPRRLMDIVFSPDGGAMYVVDFGAMFVEKEKVMPQEKTGVVWRITPAEH